MRYRFIAAFAALTLSSIASAQDKLILGGTGVAAGDAIARSTVALLMDKKALCTGSLIASKVILTAAHCVANHPNQVLIVFSNLLSPSSLASAVPAAHYVVHPDYRANIGSPDANDLALISFERPLPTGYAPVSVLPDERFLESGEKVVLAGFGISDPIQKSGEGLLRQVTVPIADAHYGKTEVLLDQRSGRGACHGDSGGPAFLKKGDTLYLWGVTSRAYPAGAPDDCSHGAIYTQIPAQEGFITEAMKSLQ